MSMCPGRVWLHWQRDLNDDIKVIQENKIEVVCSVITNTELREMNQPDLMIKLQSAGLESIQYSIHDKWLPNSMENYLVFVDSVLNHIRNEKIILVHCNGGKGRTGLIVATSLLLLGIPLDQALNMIRSVRTGMLRNPAQEVFLKALAARLREDDRPLPRAHSSPLTSSHLLYISRSAYNTINIATHTHLSDSSESIASNYDSGQEEFQANSSTEHS